MTTGFYWDERCFWLSGGNYAGTLPVGGLVQPLAAGGLPENPETKRRLKNLLDVTGLIRAMDTPPSTAATWKDLARVHTEPYLHDFKTLSDAGGGELGLRAPFGQGGFEQAALGSGLALQAVKDVVAGRVTNAYALSRPPGHHCLPDWPNGFCLLANIAVAVEAARASTPMKVAIVDWDVHHGNGTEAIYLERTDTLTISLHQDNNYPLDTGAADIRGRDNSNINIPLPPGAGHQTYLRVFDQIVLPALHRFAPDLIVVACGYDAAAIDPLSRMMATAETFGSMTDRIKTAAQALCGGRLVLVHEGGYSEIYVPFCGHATLEALVGIDQDHPLHAPDPFADTFAKRQPGAAMQGFLDGYVDDLTAFHLST